MQFLRGGSVTSADSSVRNGEETSGGTASSPEDGRLNLNTASLAELMTLSGIGQTKAQAVANYRDAHGGFSSVEEIMNVDGIKEGLYNRIRDQIKGEINGEKVLVVDDEKLIVKGNPFQSGAGRHGSGLRLRR